MTAERARARQPNPARAASLKTLAQRLARENGRDRRPPPLAEVLARLRPLVDELRGKGMRRLYVFGSVARGEERVGSDVDLMAEFDPQAPLSIVRLGSIQSRLESALDCRVDLGLRSSLKPSAAAAAGQDAVVVFE